MPVNESNPFLKASTIVLTAPTCNTLAFHQTKMLLIVLFIVNYLLVYQCGEGKCEIFKRKLANRKCVLARRNFCIVCVFSYDFQNMRIVFN